MAAGWATNAFSAFILFFNTNYLQFTFRSGHDFARLALAIVVQDALALGLVVLVAVFSFYGLCLRLVIANLAATALLYYWRPVRVGPKWNLSCLKHLFLIGAPIFGVSQIYMVWSTLDRNLVVAYTSDALMGFYTVALQAAQAFEILPIAISMVICPAWPNSSAAPTSWPTSFP